MAFNLPERPRSDAILERLNEIAAALENPDVYDDTANLEAERQRLLRELETCRDQC